MAQDEALKIARIYAESVRAIMAPKAIFLYGSHAKGTATENSDIDIAVVVDSIDTDYLSTVAKLWGLTRSVNDDIEPVLLIESESDNGFLQTVRQTGIAV
ncbi:MAG: nucleotidyltransferase domain-containing protein [Clostridia bacterium]|nr:nucleotidyltransferase domain-containing protein [Clostridia bacterium]